MRPLLAISLLVWTVGCGQVNKFTDASGGDDAAIDAKSGIDGTPFVCEDQSCGAADSCCPSACNANNDPDCSGTCNNGVLETGELCDPLNLCPSSCPAIGCQLRNLVGTQCTAHCVNGAQQSACQSGDGCCPSGCNAGNDAECAATCGNSVVESGETCDPLSSCPTAPCPQIACGTYELFNPGTCQAQCVQTGTQGTCQSDDNCCPAGCNANNDNDCAPFCGNSVVEAGETCDGNCACGGEALTCFTTTGDPSTCDLQCHVAVQTCGPVDNCCPYIQGSGGGHCRGGEDNECVTDWQFAEINWAPTSWQSGQQMVRVYGMQSGDSVLFTTCTPDGSSNTTDTVIYSVVDNNNVPLSGYSDDSYDPGALPRLAGWNCAIQPSGYIYLSTAPANDGGAILGGNVYETTVLFGTLGNGAGSARLFIWWNGNSSPNPG